MKNNFWSIKVKGNGGSDAKERSNNKNNQKKQHWVPFLRLTECLSVGGSVWDAAAAVLTEVEAAAALQSRQSA